MNITSATLTLFGSSGVGGIGQTGMHRHHHGGGGKEQMQTIADTLGISTTQLQQEMGSGSSLAQIAQNHGKTADDLINALQDKAKSRLDQAVSAGKISQDQETQFLQALKGRETSFVNGAPPPGAGAGAGAGAGVGGPGGQGGDSDGDADGSGASRGNDVASLLGMAGFQGAGPGQTTSIGQALKAYGVDTAGLEKSLIDGFKTALDKAVTGGKVSQSQEDQLMKEISSSLDQVFNADGTSTANGTNGTNPDLASLLFAKPPAGSNGAAGSSFTQQDWQATINIDFAA